MAGPAHKTRKLYKVKALPDYSLTDSTIQPRVIGYSQDKLAWQRYDNAKKKST